MLIKSVSVILFIYICSFHFEWASVFIFLIKILMLV